MCLGGSSSPKNPGTYSQWLKRKQNVGPEANPYVESASSRAEYNAELQAWNDSQPAQPEKEAVKEAEKVEAEKTAELKKKMTEDKIDETTPVVSTMEKDAPAKKRQEETKVNIEAPEPDSAAEIMKTETMEDAPESSLIKKRKQKQSDLISGLSKKRSRGRGRRSLITGKSGGGIGYYSRFFT